MRKTFYLVVVILLAALVLTACGGGGDAGDPGVDAGKELFAQSVIGSQAGCSTCHSLDGSVVVGPSVKGIGSRADEAYIRESILDPNATLVEGFPADTMPNVWGAELSDDQVDQLVAYLLTLK
jgi:mono/diheme cytochrome c family protein